MRPLIIGPDERASLRWVRAHAESHPVGLDELRRRAEAREPVRDSQLICEIPVGFRVVFTIEQHPGGWMRHLSVSVADPARLPSLDALTWIGRELGMAIDMPGGKCRAYFEPEVGPPVAVNVLEPIVGMKSG